MTNKTEIEAHLATVNRKDFRRPAIPAIYAEYELFMKSGRYPYNDEVVAEIATKYDISSENWVYFGNKPTFHHQHVHDVNDTLLINLHHEVYLASGQHRVAEMEAQEQRLAEHGFLPITDLKPKEGMKVELSSGETYRLVPVPDRKYSMYTDKEFNDGFQMPEHEWALLAPRKRTHGLSLFDMLRQHRAYQLATKERQTRMNRPVVHMFKVVGK
jgi:hypothetical protein